MKQYINLLKDVYYNGNEHLDRTGEGTIRTFGQTAKFDLANGFPILTTRKIPFRIAFEETMMFLRGQNDSKILEDKGINIWKDNTSREFLDSKALYYLKEGDMGTSYGSLWRDFEGVDQIYELLENLRTNPNSRRHVVSAWNPAALSETPLAPCHILQEYQVDGSRLNSLFFMRSCDVYHGLPFNIMSYALLNVLFSDYLGLIPGKLTFMGGDTHIYKHHLPHVETLFQRTPRKLPVINLKKHINNMFDLMMLDYDDVELIDYNPHPALKKVHMAV